MFEHLIRRNRLHAVGSPLLDAFRSLRRRSIEHTRTALEVFVHDKTPIFAADGAVVRRARRAKEGDDRRTQGPGDMQGPGIRGDHRAGRSDNGRGCAHVGIIDIRNLGLVGAVELEPIEGQPTTRAQNVFRRCFDRGVIIRTTGDTIALSPPLIIEEQQIAEIVDTLGAAIKDVD